MKPAQNTRVARLAFCGLMAALVSGCATSSGGDPTKTGAAPIRGAALMNVAERTSQSGDDATAVSLFREAHNQNPRDPAPLIGMGAALSRLGAYEQAAEAYRQAIDLPGSEAEARRGLGNALVALDRPALAIEQLLASIGLKKDARTYNGLGVAYDMQGEHAHAQAMYRAGLALKPGNLALENNLGLSLAASHDYREAIDVLSKAAGSTEAGPRERNNLALAYGLVGDMTSAARIARRDMDAAAVEKNLAMYAALRARNLGSLPVSGKAAAPAATPSTVAPAATPAPARDPAPAPGPSATEGKVPMVVGSASTPAKPKHQAATPVTVAPVAPAPVATMPAKAAPVAAVPPAPHADPKLLAAMFDYPVEPAPAPAAAAKPPTPAPVAVASAPPPVPHADPQQLAAMFDYPVAPTPAPAVVEAPAPAPTAAVPAPQPTEVAASEAAEAAAPQPAEVPTIPATPAAVTVPEPVPAAATMPEAAPEPPPAPVRPAIAPLGGGVTFRPGAMPEPVVLAATPLHGTYYRARLAEYPSRIDATQGWLDMVKRAPELYGAVEIVAERTALTAESLRYTLVTPPVAERASVVKMCVKLESRGIVCRVEAAGADPALSPRG